MLVNEERPVDLRDQVYQRLRTDILNGRVAVKARLTEGFVARELGVSRTPAREALVMLTQDGLIVLDETGFHIPELSRKDIEDIYHMRLLVEPPAVQWICLNADPADLIEACDFADGELDRHQHGDIDAFAQMVRRIRARFYQLLASEVWRETIFRFEAKARVLRFQTMQKDDVRQMSISGNRQLVHWLRRRDPDGAGAAIAMLLAAARQTTLQSLADQ